MDGTWTGEDPVELMENHKKYMLQLAELLADMCLNAALIMEAKKTMPLNPVQLDQAIDGEFSLIVTENVLSPHWVELVKKLAKKLYNEKAGL